MDKFDTQNEFAETSRLLAELQKQLISYKSALDNINGASDATGRVAEEVAKLSAVFKELNRTHVALLNGFENTRRVLLTTQQKAEQLRKDLDRLGKGFAENMASNARTGGSTRMEKALLAYNQNLGKEVRQLKNFQMVTIAMIFLLLLLSFWLGNGTAGNEQPLTNNTEQINDDPLDSPLSDVGEPEETTTENTSNDVGTGNLEYIGGQGEIETIQIQILNGCGKGGVANRFKAYLENQAYDIKNTENADHFRYPNTLILVNGPYMDYARNLANTLKIDHSNIAVEADRWQNYQLTIVIGSNYHALGPYQ